VKGLLPYKAEHKHLLWSLFFMKQYDTEEAIVSRLKCDEKTFRKWRNLILVAISSLKVVSGQNSFLMQLCCS